MTTPAIPGQGHQQIVAALDLTVMAKLFEQLKIIFPAWHTAWPNEEQQQRARMEWLKAFGENGITTREQLGRGMTKARAHNSPFLPSVGTFIAWCKVSATDLCLPDDDEAARMASRRDPLAPAAVKLAARACKWHGGNVKADEWERLFKRKYDELVARAAGGADLDAEWQAIKGRKGIEHKPAELTEDERLAILAKYRPKRGG
ncbi:replication protein P [Aeromonas sp. PrichA-15]|uniref:replication protein P n=1 Tax=Aeromonas TaxID=642 RepID=UPI001B339F1E|nr:replication protein P [Aeromonas sp. PrichA-15]MBP4031340.1 hypothetical protein [Aeromonas sp. PrichA-15]